MGRVLFLKNISSTLNQYKKTLKGIFFIKNPKTKTEKKLTLLNRGKVKDRLLSKAQIFLNSQAELKLITGL